MTTHKTGTSFTEEQQREGAYYNFRRDDPVMNVGRGAMTNPVSTGNAGMVGTDLSTYLREREGLSAFAFDDGVIYHLFRLCARGGRHLEYVPLGRPHSQGT